MTLRTAPHRLRLPCLRLLLPSLLVALVASPQLFAQAEPIVPGEPFPAGSYSNLNAAAGGPARIDLAEYLGKKPIVLFYWMAGNNRSEEVFGQIQELAAELGTERIALFGAAVPRPGLDKDKIQERLGALNIRVPVLEDTDFVIGKRLRVSSVPNITVIDGTGRLRLTNGASLVQVLGYKLDLAQAIRRTAATGELLTYGYLDRYHAVRELEGKTSPDFKAPLLTDNVEQRWHSLIDETKINVLIFWSVDCGHCRKSLPEINAWLGSHPDGVNVVSCANVVNETVKAKTREFCERNNFRFPTLVDRNAAIGDLYKITATPTIVIVRPDGIVDSVIVSVLTDFGETMEKKTRQLLSAGRPS